MPDKYRILILDDEIVIADTLAKVFANAGYESRAAHSAGQGLQLISEWSPHLAIIDVHMKEMNGIDFAIHLRKLCPDSQVALFTGLTDLTELLDKAREANHHFELIQKPAHPGEILRLAAGWLSNALNPQAELGFMSPGET